MDKPFTDSWRGRIGLVATAPGNATEADFNRYRPAGVAVLTTRTPLTASTPEGIREMNRFVDDAAALLAQNAYCDVVLLSSTAGSFVDGRAAALAHAQTLSLEIGAQVITSAECMLQALQALRAKRVTLVTPSSPELNRAEHAFLNEAGLDIVSEGGFLRSDPRDILTVTAEEIFDLVRHCDRPESDAVLLSCSGLHAMEIIAPMERELGKPVLASNQFGLWGSLRALGIPDKYPELGSLFCL